MTTLPPPTRPRLPARWRPPAQRTPRRWTPRRWRVLAMAWAFKAGHPIFKAGLWCYQCCAACADTHASGCTTLCGTVPRLIRLVFSGITTHCVQSTLTTFSDASGTTIAGTWDVPWASNCTWSLLENPGVSFNERFFDAGPAGSSHPTCGGTLTAEHLSLTFSAQIVSLSGTPTLRVELSGHGSVYFVGETAITDCTGSVTLSNSNPSGLTFSVPWQNGGGSCTATFCP